jgi:acetolactate synthase-1/2/3 large subunit
MRGKDNTRTAAEVLIDQLRIHGVRHVFCVPGESYLAALDAFHDSDIGVTVCRQEGGAAMMAEAVGKATGRPGVCFVTRGPGATNASPGIHIARQDSTPVVMFVGQVAREARERGLSGARLSRPLFGSMTKWATETTIRRACRRWSRAPSTPRRTGGLTGRRQPARGHADRAHCCERCTGLRADGDLAR